MPTPGPGNGRPMPSCAGSKPQPRWSPSGPNGWPTRPGKQRPRPGRRPPPQPRPTPRPRRPRRGWLRLASGPSTKTAPMPDPSCGHDRPVTVDVDSHIATVTFCRPPVNATVPESLIAIGEAFRALGEDREVRVAIFTGCGTRAFMAGADLKAPVRGDPAELSPSRVVDPGRYARDAMWALYDCAVPVIGAINGPAIGAGLAFASLCDVLVAADNARFGATEINAGLLGASRHLVRMVGPYKARKMFFTGELVGAEEMHRLGAVEQVVPAAELMATARVLAA